MSLTNDQRELFHLLKNHGVEKNSAIGAIIFIEDSGKSYNLLIEWIKKNNNSSRDEILEALEKLYD